MQVAQTEAAPGQVAHFWEAHGTQSQVELSESTNPSKYPWQAQSEVSLSRTLFVVVRQVEQLVEEEQVAHLDGQGTQS